MKKRRAKLYLVGQDPADIFDDLSKLKFELNTPAQRRARATETFARIPHDKALALHKHRLSSAAWVVLIELDRLILKRRGQNPVRFTSTRLRAVGIQRIVRVRALRQLASAGVVHVMRRSQGLSPWVTHLWYPIHHQNGNAIDPVEGNTSDPVGEHP